MFAADVPVPAWEAQPDVWLLIGLLAAGYWIACVRLGPRLAPNPQRPVTRLQVLSYSLGVFTTWLAADWPIHETGEQSLFSVHMTQHMAFAVVAVPLLLMGTPAWLARWLLSPRWLLRTAQQCARFVPAILIFNGVLIFTHWPWYVTQALSNGFVHFLGHSLLVVSSIIIWLPVLSPLPEIPRFSPLVRLVYLFTQSLLPTVPASFLTMGSGPLYRWYVDTPRVFGISVLEDQRAAGLIMKSVTGLILWGVITVVFFRWAADEERRQRRVRRIARSRAAAESRSTMLFAGSNGPAVTETGVQ